MLRLTRTGRGALSRRYASILKKCLLINLGVFGLGTALSPSDASAEVTALSSTLDRINSESVAFLGGTHGQYTLTSSSSTGASKVMIGGTTYYYTPNEGSAEANQKLINLVNTGGAALTTEGATSTNYIFTDGTNYYIYDTSKFAKSGIKISTTSTGAAGEQTVTQSKADGTTVTYYINHEAPYTNTGTQNTNLTENISNKNYSGLTTSSDTTGGALGVKSGSTVDYITGDFSDNKNTGSSQTRGGAIYNGGTIGHITGDFYNNTVASRAGAIGNNNKVTSIVGDFYGNSATSSDATGGAIFLRSGSTDLIMGNFVNNTAKGGKDGGAINISEGHKVGQIIGNFVGNSVQDSSADRGGGAIKIYLGKVTEVTADFTDNSGIHGGAINIGGGSGDKVITTLNGTFVNNTATTGDGGAIYNTGTISTLNGEFVSNTAGNYGGAIYTTSGSFGNTGGITADFSQNSAKSGGAIYNTGTGLYTINGDFENNSATAGDGGAIYNSGNMQKKDSTPSITGDFIGNTASGKGGAIFNTGGSDSDSNHGRIAQIDGDFKQNTATYGGAVYNEGYSFVTNVGAASDFIQNTASNSGGAIYNTNKVGNITGKFTENEATTGSGGAVYNTGTMGNLTGVEVNSETVIFSENTAGTSGGAIYNTGTMGTITGDITDNTATAGDGGAIYNTGTMGTITGDITDNTATAGDGGAIYNTGTITLTGNVSGNSATAGLGGAIYNEGTVNIATNSTDDILFSNNQDSTGSNDIYNNAGEINLQAAANRKITFNGTIAGTGATTLNATGGNYVFNNGVYAKEINLTNVDSFKLGKTNTTHGSFIDSIDSLTIDDTDTLFDMQNGTVDTISVTDLDLGSSPVALAIDASFQDNTYDRINVTNTALGQFLVEAINVTADKETDEIKFILPEYYSVDVANLTITGTDNVFKQKTYDEGTNTLTLSAGTIGGLTKIVGDWSDGNYIVAYDEDNPSTTSLGANVQALDAAVGKVENDGNYIKAFDSSDIANTSIAANLEALDTAIGKVDTAGHYIMTDTSVSGNLQALDNALYDFDSYLDQEIYEAMREQVPGVKAVRIDKAGLDSKTYLEDHPDTHYTLSEDSSAGSMSLKIGSKTYYYDGDTEIDNLITDGYATFKQVTDAQEISDEKYLFTDGTKYWTLDTTKHSGTKIVESNSNDYNYAEEQSDGSLKYYKVIHVVPKDYTIAEERIASLATSIDEVAFYNLHSEPSTPGGKIAGGGAISIKGNTVVDHITADFKGNSTTGTQDSAGALYVPKSSTLNNLTGSFEANVGMYGGVVQNKGNIGTILGDFINNEDMAGGAAIDNNGSITMVNGDFLGNFDKTAADDESEGRQFNGGGAIRNTKKDGTYPAYIGTIKGQFTNNYALGKFGGAINNQNVIDKIDATFTGNSAHQAGGAIYNMAKKENTSLGQIGSITGTFLQNTAGTDGGAIYNHGINTNASPTGSPSTIPTAVITKITNTTFDRNEAGGSGGAIYNTVHGQIKEMSNVKFIDNEAGEYGGAIAYYGNGKEGAESNKITSLSILFSGNTAGFGGALYLNQGEIGSLSADFIENKAGLQGGAILLENNSKIDELEGNFTGNTLEGGSGGAIYVDNSEISKLTGNFTNNIASMGWGGAIYNAEGTVNLSADTTNMAFYNNQDMFGLTDIYTNTGTINMNAAEGHQISFGGAVTGSSSNVSDNKLNLNTSEGVTGGTYIFNNALKNYDILWDNSANIKFGSQVQEDGSTTYGYSDVGSLRITQSQYVFKIHDDEGGYYNYLTYDPTSETAADWADYMDGNPNPDIEMYDITDKNSSITLSSGVEYKFKSAISDAVWSDLVSNSPEVAGNTGSYVFKYGDQSWSIGSSQNDAAITRYLDTISSTYTLSTTYEEGKAHVVIGGVDYYYEPDATPGASPIAELIAGGAIIQEVSVDDAVNGTVKAVFNNEDFSKYWTITPLGSGKYDLTKYSGTTEFEIDKKKYVYTAPDDDIIALTDADGNKYLSVRTAVVDTINEHLDDNNMQELHLDGDVKLRVDVDLGNSNNFNDDGIALGIGSDTFKTRTRTNNTFGDNDDKMIIVDSINLLSASRKDAVAVQVTNEFNRHLTVSSDILENITGADNLHGKVEYREETGELVVHDRFAVISDLADALNTLVEGEVAHYHGLYETDENGDIVYLKATDEGADRYYNHDGSGARTTLIDGFTEDDGYLIDPTGEKIKKFDPLVGTITYSSNDESVTEADDSPNGIFHQDEEGNYDNDYRFVKGRAVRLLDATLVHNTGDETIQGIKTFESPTVGEDDEATKYTTAVNGTTITMSKVVGTDTPTTTTNITFDGSDGSADFAGDVTIGGLTKLDTTNGLQFGDSGQNVTSIVNEIDDTDSEAATAARMKQLVTAEAVYSYVDENSGTIQKITVGGEEKPIVDKTVALGAAADAGLITSTDTTTAASDDTVYTSAKTDELLDDYLKKNITEDTTVTVADDAELNFKLGTDDVMTIGKNVNDEAALIVKGALNAQGISATGIWVEDSTKPGYTNAIGSDQVFMKDGSNNGAQYSAATSVMVDNAQYEADGSIDWENSGNFTIASSTGYKAYKDDATEGFVKTIDISGTTGNITAAGQVDAGSLKLGTYSASSISRAISSSSTHDELTTAKAVYDYVEENGGKIQKITVGGEEKTIVDKTVALGAAADAGLITSTDTTTAASDDTVYTSAKTDELLDDYLKKNITEDTTVTVADDAELNFKLGTDDVMTIGKNVNDEAALIVKGDLNAQGVSATGIWVEDSTKPGYTNAIGSDQIFMKDSSNNGAQHSAATSVMVDNAQYEADGSIDWENSGNFTIASSTGYKAYKDDATEGFVKTIDISGTTGNITAAGQVDAGSLKLGTYSASSISRAISSSSTHDELTTAKAVYDYVEENGGKIQKITVGGVEKTIVDKTVALGAAADAGLITSTDTTTAASDDTVYTSAKTNSLIAQVVTDVTDGVTEMYNHAHNWAEYILGVDVDEDRETQLQTALGTTNYLGSSTNFVDAFKALDTQAKVNADDIDTLEDTKYDKTGGTISGDVSVTGTLGVTGLTTLNALNAGATNVSSFSIGSTEGRPIIASIEKAITASADDTQLVTALGTKTYVDNAITGATKYVSVNSTYTDDDSASATGTDSIAVGMHSTASGLDAAAFGDYAKAAGERSIAVGNSAQANNDYGIAIGGLSRANAAGGVALGTSANVTGANGIALGNSSKAEGATSVALGQAADAKGESAISIGTSSQAATTGVALGHAANASGESGIAIGTNSSAAKTAAAIGHGASASAESSMALGVNASATAVHAVALGTGSVAGEANTVSVGNSTQKRRIVNVAAGTADNDVVIVSQLNDVIDDMTVAENGNYITAGTDVAANLEALDSGLGAKQAGTYIATSNTVNQNLKALDTQVKANTDDMTVADTGNYITAGTDVAANLEALDSGLGAKQAGTYIATSNTVNQNLKALDTKLNTDSVLLDDNGADVLVDKSASGSTALIVDADKSVVSNVNSIANYLRSAQAGIQYLENTMITADGAVTLTNKTIDADTNTITNLEADNFKAGVIDDGSAQVVTGSPTKLASTATVLSSAENGIYTGGQVNGTTADTTIKGALTATNAQVDTNTAAINILNGDVTTNGSVLKSVKDNAVTGTYNSAISYADGTIGAAIQSKQNALSAGNGIDITNNEISVDYAGGLTIGTGENLGKLMAKVDNSTVGLNDSGAIYVKDDGITTAKILDGNVTKAKLAQAVQDSLDLADSAVQSVAEGSTNGTISVDGTDVAVHGLGSAAYTDSSSYVTVATEQTVSGAKTFSSLLTASNGLAVTGAASFNNDVTISGLTKLNTTNGLQFGDSGQNVKSISTSISSSSTNTELTTAKAVYDYVDENGGKIQKITVGGVEKTIVDKTVALGAAADAGLIKTTDTTTAASDNTVYTSAKTNALLADKQDALTAGNGIDITSDEISVDYGAGLTIGTGVNAGKLIAKVDDSTVSLNDSGALYVKAGGITSTELAANSVITAKILDGNVTKAKLSDAVQTSLGLADSAIQTAIINNKTITNASNSITLGGADLVITGYEKADEATAIAETDTINVALGKLEKGLEAATTGGITTFKVNGEEVTKVDGTVDLEVAEGETSGTLKVNGTDIAVHNVVTKDTEQTISGAKTFSSLLTANNGLSVTGASNFYDDVTIGTSSANRNLTVNGELSTTGLASLNSMSVANAAGFGGLATFSTTNGMRFGSGQVVTSIVNVIDFDAADEVLQSQLVTAKAVKVAIAAEASAREAADDILSGRIDSAETAITNETIRATTAEGALAQSISNVGTALSDNVNILVDMISDESTRAAQAEAQLGDAIVAETNRAAQAEGQLGQAIINETNRAAQAEGQLGQAISDETARAAASEGQLAQAIADERTHSDENDAVLNGLITAEANRAAGVEGQLGQAINDETARATAAESQLAQAIADERTHSDENDAVLNGLITAEANRAAGVEGQLGQAINDETARATAAEGDLAQAISDETARAAASEGQLAQAIADERTHSDENDAVLSGLITAEANRAAGVEGQLGQAINDEVARATAAEGDLAQAISDETARAADAEGQLAQAIADERTHSDENDAVLSGLITAEANRAAQVEGQLGQAINDEVARATAAEGALAQSISDVGTALSDNVNILAGMISDETTRAATAEGLLGDAINDEVARATNAEGQLAQAIADERTHSDENDAVLNGLITAEANRAAGVEGQLGQAINDETARATAAEGDLAQAISDETARAAAAEGQLAQAITDTNTALSDNVNILTGMITDEANRAAQVEGQLGLAINDEIARATNAEGQLAQAIADERTHSDENDAILNNLITDETNRATAVEGQLGDAIVAETNRAAQAEGDLAQAITDETNRAANAEGQLAQAISDETNRAANAEGQLAQAIADERTHSDENDAILNNLITDETNRAAAVEGQLGDAIVAEKNRAANAEGQLAQAIADEAQTRADADTALAADIAANTADIATLNGDVDTAGSVLNSIRENAAKGTYNSAAVYADDTIGAAIQDLEEGSGGQAKDIDALKKALGGSFDPVTDEWSADLEISTGPGAVNYGNYTVKKVEVALEKIMSNVGSADDLGEEYNGVSTTNTVNKNIASLNSTIGNFEELNDSTNFTNGKPGDAGYNVPENVVGVLNNIDKTLGTVHGLTDKLREAGTYKGNLSDEGTVETHLAAVDTSIGDRSAFSNSEQVDYTTTGMNNKDIVTAVSQVASNIGTGADLGDEYNGVSANNTVNKNIAAINSSIGDITTLRETIYTSDADNITDAIVALDSNMYRLDNQVSDLNNKYRKLDKDFRRGMASMAAMSAMAPNARAKGDTQLTLGTGAYDRNTAAAIGLFHWINNNVMVNMGVAWGSSSNAVYRMGLTYTW